MHCLWRGGVTAFYGPILFKFHRFFLGGGWNFSQNHKLLFPVDVPRDEYCIRPCLYLQLSEEAQDVLACGAQCGGGLGGGGRVVKVVLETITFCILISFLAVQLFTDVKNVHSNFKKNNGKIELFLHNLDFIILQASFFFRLGIIPSSRPRRGSNAV